MATQVTRQSRIADNLKRWRERPERFVIEVIGGSPDPWQVDALRAIAAHKKVSIAACHGVGKDTLAAWLVLWFMFCFPHPKIPCTAPTSAQLYDLLWSEISKWFVKVHPALRSLYEMKAKRFERKTHRETWFAVARTARQGSTGESLQGFHADNILVVVDEASGVPNVIFEVLEGALTGPNALCLLIGNPTQTSGYFFDSHHTDRARWHTMRILAAAAHDGSPTPEGTYASKRVSPEYVRSMEKKYGRESNVFRVRVLGLFPNSDDDQVIPLEWIEQARAREVRIDPRKAISIGGDVARFGSDASAAVVRQGNAVLHAEQWHGNSVTETTGRFVRLGLDWERQLSEAPDDVIYFFIDTVGVGAGVADNLRVYIEENRKRWVVIDVESGASALDEHTQRLRDTLWWKAREWFRLGEPAFAPHTDEDGNKLTEAIDYETLQQLTAELASPKYDYLPNGKIKVESKQDMKDRDVDSPNLADALVYTMLFDAIRPEVDDRPQWMQDRDSVESPWI